MSQYAFCAAISLSVIVVVYLRRLRDRNWDLLQLQRTSLCLSDNIQSTARLPGGTVKISDFPSSSTAAAATNSSPEKPSRGNRLMKHLSSFLNYWLHQGNPNGNNDINQQQQQQQPSTVPSSAHGNMEMSAFQKKFLINSIFQFNVSGLNADEQQQQQDQQSQQQQETQEQQLQEEWQIKSMIRSNSTSVIAVTPPLGSSILRKSISSASLTLSQANSPELLSSFSGQLSGWGNSQEFQNCPFDMLSTELILHIFSYLRPADLCRVSTVSKYFHKMALDGSLWKTITIKRYLQLEVISKVIKRVGVFLKTLEIINFSSNTTVDEFKTMLSQCHSVQNLTIRIPNDFGRYNFLLTPLTRLEFLSSLSLCGSDGLTNSHLEILKSIPSLTSLNLKNCPKITSLGFTAISKAENLTFLDVSGNFTGKGITALLTSPAPLRTLILKDCKNLTDAVIVNLAKPSLTDLVISNCQLLTSPALEAFFAQTPNLRRLNMSECPKIGDLGLKMLSNHCKLLEELYCAGCPITNVGLEAILTGLPLLHTLDVSTCSNTIANAFFDKKNSSLKKLDMFCTRISNEQLELLSTSLPNLTSLAITNNRLLNRFGIYELVKNCPLLKILDFSGCQGVDDNCLSSISTYCNQLNSLSVMCCQQITDLGVKQLVTGCRKLHTLNLANCSSITNDAVKILRQMPNLRRLDVYLCSNVSFSAVKKLKAKSSQLVVDY